MKNLIVLAIILITNSCFSQSISSFLKIKSIKQIKISFAMQMNIDSTDNKIFKIIDDVEFINDIEKIINTLPAKGSIWKKFPQNIPTWRIEIIDQNDNSHKLHFFGIKLRVPDSSSGAYYSYVQEIGDLEKQLYYKIRSQIIGNW